MNLRLDLTDIDLSDDGTQAADLRGWMDSTIQGHPVLRKAFQENRAGMVLADISESRKPQWAAVNADLEIYGASVPKLGILLGILYNHANSIDQRKRVLSEFENEIFNMINKSDNLESGKLYALTSLASIKAALAATGLFQWNEVQGNERGGLWCGAVYNTADTKKWFSENPQVSSKYPIDFSEEKSPKSGELFALTARAGASFLLLMETGQLLNPEYSEIAKRFTHKISTSKFIKGIQRDDANVEWFGKTGTFNGNLSEVTLVRGAGYSYILTLLISGHRQNDVFEFVGTATNAFVRSRT